MCDDCFESYDNKLINTSRICQSSEIQKKRAEIEKLYDTFTFPSEQKEKAMNEKQLLEFFDIHKNGQIDIRHAWTEKLYNATISLEDLFEMFRLWLIRRDNAVTQD